VELQCAMRLQHAHQEDSKGTVPKANVSDAVTLINGTGYCRTHAVGVPIR
jgi:hypothetical protein